MKPVLCLYYSTMKFGVIIIRSGSPMLIVEKNFNQGSFSLFSQNLEKVEKILMFYCFLVEEIRSFSTFPISHVVCKFKTLCTNVNATGVGNMITKR